MSSLYCADVRFLNLDIPVSSVVTDAPYSAHTHSSASTMRGGRAGRNDLKFAPLDPLLRARIAYDIARATGYSVIWTDYQGAERWKQDVRDFGGEFVREIPWVRWSMPQLSADRPPQGSELVLLFRGKNSGRLVYNGPGNLTHFKHKCLRGKDKHKTQKPLDQVLDIIEFFTQPGDTIIDHTMGRGTTCLAAKLLGREYFGIEIKPDEFELASARVAAGDSFPDPKDRLAWGLYLENRRIRIIEMARLKAHTQGVVRRRAAKEIALARRWQAFSRKCA